MSAAAKSTGRNSENFNSVKAVLLDRRQQVQVERSKLASDKCIDSEFPSRRFL